MKKIEQEKVLTLAEELGGEVGFFYPKQFPLLVSIQGSNSSCFLALRCETTTIALQTGDFAKVTGLGLAFGYIKKDKVRTVIELKNDSGESCFWYFRSGLKDEVTGKINLLGMVCEDNFSLAEIFISENCEGPKNFLSTQSVTGETAFNTLALRFAFAAHWLKSKEDTKL